MSQKELLKKHLPIGWRFKPGGKTSPRLFTPQGDFLSLDFFGSSRPLSFKQPLMKAIGFKGLPLRVLDLTAGWGKEAFLIAQKGCFVKALESNPLVFYFVQESFIWHQSLKDFKKKDLSLDFILDNSLNYLNTLTKEALPEVIFIDPMFGEEKKSLSQKSMRILKQLVGNTKQQKLLFNLALKKAKKRVVVKRHRLEQPFKTPIFTFKGRSICYDIF